jgi:hypothetical protein
MFLLRHFNPEKAVDHEKYEIYERNQENMQHHGSTGQVNCLLT